MKQLILHIKKRPQIAVFLLVALIFRKQVSGFVKSIIRPNTFGSPDVAIKPKMSKQEQERIITHVNWLYEYMSTVTGITGQTIYDDLGTILGYMQPFAQNKQQIEFFVNTWGRKDYGALHSWFGFDGWTLYQWLNAKLDQSELNTIHRNIFSSFMSIQDFTKFCKE
jgi:hypothetical protein